MIDNPTGGQLIKLLNDAIERQANNQLRRQGLTMVQVWVLLTLHDHPGNSCSFKELESILGVAQSTCAGIVNRLALKKYVVCYPDPQDRRAKHVRITPDGERCCQEAEQDIRRLEKLMFQGFTREEEATLRSLLFRVFENIK